MVTMHPHASMGVKTLRQATGGAANHGAQPPSYEQVGTLDAGRDHLEVHILEVLAHAYMLE
jgi:hypothetical protein